MLTLYGVQRKQAQHPLAVTTVVLVEMKQKTFDDDDMSKLVAYR